MDNSTDNRRTHNKDNTHTHSKDNRNSRGKSNNKARNNNKDTRNCNRNRCKGNYHNRKSHRTNRWQDMIQRKVAWSGFQNHTGLSKGWWSPPVAERTEGIEPSTLLAILLLAE